MSSKKNKKLIEFVCPFSLTQSFLHHHRCFYFHHCRSNGGCREKGKSGKTEEKKRLKFWCWVIADLVVVVVLMKMKVKV